MTMIFTVVGVTTVVAEFMRFVEALDAPKNRRRKRA